jgi:hypothetical protein
MNQSNDITLAVIEYLTQPGSDFGTQPDDVESLRSLETLAAQLRLRLEIPREDEDEARRGVREQLQQRDLSSVDWPHVMQELRSRLHLTDGFFQQDLQDISSDESL